MALQPGAINQSPEQIGPQAPPPVAGAEMAQEAPADPVIGAMQTIQTFLAAQAEQGNPKAQEIINAWQGFLQTLQTTSGMEQPGMPPQAPPAPAGPQQIGENVAPDGSSTQVL